MRVTAQSKFIGLGVAGNFAGHLEQAGEAADFVAVKVDDKVAPKALFPFYVPDHPGQLGVFPLSGEAILLPEAAVSGDEKVQIEPEVALWCELEYAGEQVVAIHPKAFGAYNDCSIRRPNARKISEKKNWGEQSKGLAPKLRPLTHFAPAVGAPIPSVPRRKCRQPEQKLVRGNVNSLMWITVTRRGDVDRRDLRGLLREGG